MGFCGWLYLLWQPFCACTHNQLSKFQRHLQAENLGTPNPDWTSTAQFLSWILSSWHNLELSKLPASSTAMPLLISCLAWASFPNLMVAWADQTRRCHWMTKWHQHRKFPANTDSFQEKRKLLKDWMISWNRELGSEARNGCWDLFKLLQSSLRRHRDCFSPFYWSLVGARSLGSNPTRKGENK